MIRRSIALVPAVLLASFAAAGSANAQAVTPYTCVMPVAPDPIDGASATRQQVIDARTAVTKFMADSDAFQSCVGAHKIQYKAHALLNGLPENLDEENRGLADVAANQAAKKKAGDDINAAIAAYKAAHP